jgi:hypothetical protein
MKTSGARHHLKKKFKEIKEEEVMSFTNRVAT